MAVTPRTRVDERVVAIARALHERYARTAALDTIVAQVETAFAVYRDAPVTDFVPILVARRVRANLRVVTASATRPPVSPVLVDATRCETCDARLPIAGSPGDPPLGGT